MREFCYEVLMLNSSDETVFPERLVDGKIFVVAEPGCEYHVKVNIYKNSDGNWPARYIRVGLYIDGVDVQYWKRLDMTDSAASISNCVTASFWGFKRDSNDLRSFIFANPSFQDSSSSSVSDKPLGQIRVVIHEAEVVEGIFHNKSGTHVVPHAPESISEGKKFWQQASVRHTCSGSYSTIFT